VIGSRSCCCRRACSSGRSSTSPGRSRAFSAVTSASSPNRRWQAGPSTPGHSTSESRISRIGSTSIGTSARGWFDEHGDELAELAAAKVELGDRDGKARDRRINDVRRDPPEWVTERLGRRPDDPAAREHWDRAAAHLEDYRHAFGQPPGDELPDRGDYRQRHAWEQVHDAATKALEVHPERPVVERPPPQLHRDIGLDIGR
jgi:hypothetical protein